MSGIFVSYRRASSAAVVYRLVDELKERFGDEAIFFDVESIEAGASFSQAIQLALSKSTIALIVIGPQWVHVKDEHGNRRLESPDDWVRHEVSAALNSRARVIPLLVEGAEIPPHDLLPDNIKELANLQAFTFAKSPEYWDFDIKRLEERLRKIDKNLPRVGKQPDPIRPDPVRPEPTTTGGFSKKVMWGYGLTAFFSFGFAAPDPDATGFYGIALFFGLAFVVHLLGLFDINKGLTRGKWAAICGMVLCAFLGLAAVGAAVELESYAVGSGYDENEVFTDTQQLSDDVQQTSDALDQYEAETPAPDSTQRGLTGVQKPPFKPQSDEPDYPQEDVSVEEDDTDYTYFDTGGPDITGTWSSNIGTTYQFGNNLNGSMFFYEFNAFQVQVGYGEGGFIDGVFTFEYTNTLLQTSAIVQMQMSSTNGNLLQANAYVDVNAQPVSFELYRQSTGFGL